MCGTNKTFPISFLSCFLTREETDFHEKAASGAGMSKISLLSGEGGRGDDKNLERIFLRKT